MKAKISVRQICFIMLVYTAVSKFILYPTMLAFESGRDLLWAAALDFLIQGIIIWAVSYLCSRTDKTFFQLIEGTLGNITARVVYGLFALFFIVCTIIPLFEQMVYVHDIFYDTVPSLIVILPLFFFAIYAATKNFDNIGRCADICLPIFLVSMLFIFSMSVLEVEWSAFLPVLKMPLTKVFGSSLASAYRFFEPCWLLMFMGHFKYEKGDATKITFSYAGGAVITMFLLAVFYGIYGEASATRQFAISKVSLFFPAIDVIGRIDLIALYALEAVMMFALVLNIQLAVYCLTKCTGYKNKPVFSLIVNGILIAMLLIFNNKFSALHELWTKWFWIIFIVFANVMPLLAWALKRRTEND